MILRIRKSRWSKRTSLFMAVLMFATTFEPAPVYALTGGPAQPEFNSFTPIGTSDMVDLSSGDFSYNIPLMDIGGFPINLAYSSGVTMDQEASWVGLGWDLSIGQINRNMRGLPDDFNGDDMQYEKNVRDNTTIGASFQFNPALFGIDELPNTDDDPDLTYSVGLGVEYNTYNGVSITPSLGLSYEIAGCLSAGLNVKSGPDGLTLSPSVSLSTKVKSQTDRQNSLGASVGVSFNSRQGLSALTMNASASTHRTVRNKIMGHEFSSQRGGSVGIGSAVSYVDNTYTPQAQDGMDNASGTFNAALGAEFFGGEGQGQIAAYFSTQYLSDDAKDHTEDAFGYNNTHVAHKNAVLDFNREKDGNFSVNTTNLPITNYTYDIYSVQGQGVAGMFRPYRSQVGYVHDKTASGKGIGGSLGLEIGVGNAVHNGFDIEVTKSSNESGDWTNNNNAHDNFEFNSAHGLAYEEVYYKNVGDLSVDDEASLYRSDATLGDYKPVRLKLGGEEYERTVEDTFQIKDPYTAGGFDNTAIPAGGIKRQQRVRRNQNIQELSVYEIKEADADGVMYPGIDSAYIHSSAEDHHTGAFIVTRNDGARYVYGKALYNTEKREVTFAAAGLTSTCSTGYVAYTAEVDNTKDNDNGDHYFDRVTTPPYAHTYLLTALLSADYSDLTGNGPSVDDLGSYTLFTYHNPDSVTYRWRSPYLLNKANYNEGLRTDPDDDKGSYVYGKKDVQYIKKIETKTHVALFYTSKRHDGYGVTDENGGADMTSASTPPSSKMRKLNKIELFSRGELYNSAGAIVGAGTDLCGNTTTTAIPIKTVHFEYDYSLCDGVPNNDEKTTDYDCDGVADNNDGGKLTLKKVYFTYRESNMGKYSPYEFTYGDTDHDGDQEANPNYDFKDYDVWGYYKPSSGTCGVDNAPTAAEFPYVDQDNAANTDLYAQAWSLTDIHLPSGGNIQVDYESDDYRSVQDRGVMRMFKVVGAGPDATPAGDYIPDVADKDAFLYKTGINHFQADYLYIQKPSWYGAADPSNAQLSADLLKYNGGTISNVQFRFFTNMSEAGGTTNSSGWNDEDFDYVTGYFKLDGSALTSFTSGGTDYISIPVQLVEMEGGAGGGQEVNPISKAGWQFARKYLARYAYGLSGVDEGQDAEGIIYQLTGASVLNNLLEIFQGPNGALKDRKVARRFIKDKSWIRLLDPSHHKKGGGVRVSQLVMTDEWAEMTADEETPVTNDPRDQEYGQVYSYELENGQSSGVATYEPIGCKENPFVQPVFAHENRLLAPDEENYMERPFGESFFPSPQVTYGRVSVKNIEREDTGNDIAVRKHATGEVITEFYTSADYPTIADQTQLQVEEDENQLLQSLLNINVKKHITLTQGYVVVLNDMNGKMKSQRVYAEGAAGLNDYLSGVDYVYDGFTLTSPGSPAPFPMMTPSMKMLNNEVLALYPNGKLDKRILGVEYDVINDFREMRSETTVAGVNTNVATFFMGIIPAIVPVPLPDYSYHEDKLNMVSTTKVVNTFGILRETVAHDVGASVSTRNLVWDAYTGDVLITETVNEYGDNYYSMNFPAHWNYSGMGMACQNAGIVLPFIPHGAIPNGYKPVGGVSNPSTFLHNGDEVWVTSAGVVKRAWVDNVTNTYFRLLDLNGDQLAYTTADTLVVLRSGRRNLQSTSMASIVSQTDPVTDMTTLSDYDGNGYVEKQIPTDFLEGTTHKIVNAGAVEFSDLWSLQCECGMENTVDTLNPYLNNTEGTWRAKRSHLYLTGRTTSGANPSPRNDGYYATFSPFYQVNSLGKWAITSTDWTFTSQVTEFNTKGFEIENEDALHRYSAAQYGYNFTFPMAVGANTRYSEIGNDNFEDYAFDGCIENEHFGFRDAIGGSFEADTTSAVSHTGRFSLVVNGGEAATKVYHIECD
jgi:hypothetical protein